MATDIFEFAVKVTAGTPKATPLVTQLPLGVCDVERIDVFVPPGPRGELHFYLSSGKNQIFPSNIGTYFTPENMDKEFPVSNQMDSGAWEITAYNTGQYDHTIYLAFLTNPVTNPYDALPAAVPTVVGLSIPT